LKVEMFEGRQILPFENRIWSFMAPIEEDPVESRVQVCCFEDIRITDKRGKCVGFGCDGGG